MKYLLILKKINLLQFCSCPNKSSRFFVKVPFESRSSMKKFLLKDMTHILRISAYCAASCSKYGVEFAKLHVIIASK